MHESMRVTNDEKHYDIVPIALQMTKKLPPATPPSTLLRTAPAVATTIAFAIGWACGSTSDSSLQPPPRAWWQASPPPLTSSKVISISCVFSRLRQCAVQLAADTNKLRPAPPDGQRQPPF